MNEENVILMVSLLRTRWMEKVRTLFIDWNIVPQNL